MKIELLAQRHW